jgi:hypothetical protein
MPENKDIISEDSVLRLAARFPSVVSEEAYDALEEEVMDYLLTPTAHLPSVNRVDGNPTGSEDLCTYWQKMGTLETIEGNFRFPNLVNLAKCLIALPHSNADTERVFSIVRKIVTDYRTELDQSTLCALVACKLNDDSKCFKLDTPTDLLQTAKSSTSDYNKEHKKHV